MKQKKLIRCVFIVLLAVTAFHLSGVEAAFCDDGLISNMTASHGCSVCQSGSHSVSTERTTITFTEWKVSFISLENLTLQIKEPSRFIFRPPISL